MRGAVLGQRIVEQEAMAVASNAHAQPARGYSG
jgi:hypothetical protein